MNLTELAMRRPVFTVIVYVAVTIFGVYALHKLPLDLYPQMENPIITVVTSYPGASSWDVEEKITKPMEKGLGILPGLKEITSKSMEGVSAVFLRFTYATNLDEAANDVRNSVDWVVRHLPDGLDKPMLFKFDTAYFPIYFGAIVSDVVDAVNERTYLEDHVIQSLQGLPGVGSVQLFHVAADEVHVRVKLAEVEKRSMTFTQISQALAVSNCSLPAGRLDDPDYELPLRVPAEYRTIEEISDQVVGMWDGRPVHLRDVADVRDAHHDLRNISTLNGRSIAVFMVQKQSQGNTVEVARQVRERLAELAPSMGKGMRFVKIWDGSEFIEAMVGNLYESLILGGLLVVLVVIAFLGRARASFIIALAIPGSMIISFLLLYLKQYTLNAISLMAMTLSIGMVVDNSIVVLENINRHLDWGEDPRASSIAGTREVSLAVSASTLTTVGIFLPIVFVTGLVSILFGQLAYVVVITLVASLVTSLFLTPMLTARLLKPAAEGERRETWLKRGLDGMDAAYSRIARMSLKHRGRVYAGMTALFLASAGSLITVGFDFLPVFDSGEVRVTAELPQGTSIERSARFAERMAAEFEKVPEVKDIYYQAGEDEQGWSVVMGQAQGSNVIQFSLLLKSLNLGRRGIKEVSEDVRAIVSRFEGLVSVDVNFGDQGGMPTLGVKPFIVEVLGQDYERLKQAARDIETAIKRIGGTRDVAAEVPYDKPEVQMRLDRRRMSSLGVTAFSAADAVRTAVYGSTVTRFRGGGKDVEVVLRLRPEDRDNLADVGRVLVPSLAGAPVSLRNFSEVTSGFSPVSVEHASQQRVLRIGANLAEASLGEVTAEFERVSGALKQKYPDMTIRYGGQAKEQQETGMELAIMLLLGVVLTYLIMAAQFESFMDPFVIMFSVPFAFTGSFLALFATGENFNVLAFLGVIMLVGIVVNNAIVLVDYVNFMRRQGTLLIDAVVETARRRLRPILMTTITTLFGIVPLALASGEGYELWRPIGITMIGGLSLSTLVTLIIIPCMYVSFERFRRKGRFAR